MNRHLVPLPSPSSPVMPVSIFSAFLAELTDQYLVCKFPSDRKLGSPLWGPSSAPLDDCIAYICLCFCLEKKKNPLLKQRIEPWFGKGVFFFSPGFWGKGSEPRKPKSQVPFHRSKELGEFELLTRPLQFPRA